MAYLQWEDDDIMQANSGPPGELPESHLEFLDGLPDDTFSPEEELLRDLILDVLTVKGPRSLEQLNTNESIRKALKAFNPAPHRSHSFLSDWVERRIGGEVELVCPQGVLPHDAKLWSKKTILRLFRDARPPTGPPSARDNPYVAQSGAMELDKKGASKGKSTQAWLMSLPQGSFLRPEIDLREAIFDFLARWRIPGKAFVRDLEVHPPLRAICAYLFPPGVSLADWIEHRVGAEVQVLRDGSIHLRGGAVQIVQQKSMYLMEMERRHAYAAAYGSPPLPPGPNQDALPDGVEPTLDIPPNVKGIRKILQKGIRKDPEAFERPMSFTDLKRLMDSLGVQFIVAHVAKVATELGESSPAGVVRRYCQDLVKLGKAEGGGKRKRDEAGEEQKEGQQNEIKKRRERKCQDPTENALAEDAFFAALPSDELLPGEVAFAKKLQECDGMDLGAAQNVAVAEKNMLLQDVYGEPKGRLPLRKWIEDRVADYIIVEPGGPKGNYMVKAVFFSMGLESGEDVDP